MLYPSEQDSDALSRRALGVDRMMDSKTAHALDSINRRFYREGATRFDTTRQRPWAGWERLLSDLNDRGAADPLRILDVGCGNLRFLRFLEARGIALSRYVGLDRSHELLTLAGAITRARGGLVESDLVTHGLASIVERAEFDRIVLFGVLHHLPGFARRLELLRTCRKRLAPGGKVIATLWCFREDPSIRILPWSESRDRAGVWIDPSCLEPGDALLPFSDDASLCRYAHHFDDAEVTALVAGAGFEIVVDYRADGDGRSNRYLILSAVGTA